MGWDVSFLSEGIRKDKEGKKKGEEREVCVAFFSPVQGGFSSLDPLALIPVGIGRPTSQEVE